MSEDLHPSSEVQDGANSAPKPQSEWSEVEAKGTASLAGEEKALQAEALDQQSDRQAAIELYLMDNELFGFEPYSPEVLADLSSLLHAEEIKYREADLNFDITETWSEKRILRFFERKYIKTEEDEVADKREDADENYKNTVAAVRKNDPDIDNLNLCQKLLAQSDKLPKSEIPKLQAFVDMQSLAATPEDQAVVDAKVNALNFDGGIPDPMGFMQTTIFTAPDISEASKEAMATHFKVPRFRDASQMLDTLEQVRANDGQFKNADGQMVKFDKNNGVPVGRYTVYPDPADHDAYVASARVGGRILQVPFSPDDDPSHLDEIMSAAMITQVLANRDLQAANRYVVGGDGLAAQGVTEIRLDEVQVKRAEQLYGAFMGFGTELRTGFPSQSDLREFERRLQATHIDGDAKTGDNTGRGDLSWQQIGMLGQNGQINMDVVEAVGAHINKEPISLPEYSELVNLFGDSGNEDDPDLGN